MEPTNKQIEHLTFCCFIASSCMQQHWVRWFQNHSVLSACMEALLQYRKHIILNFKWHWKHLKIFLCTSRWSAAWIVPSFSVSFCLSLTLSLSHFPSVSLSLALVGYALSFELPHLCVVSCFALVAWDWWTDAWWLCLHCSSSVGWRCLKMIEGAIGPSALE